MLRFPKDPFLRKQWTRALQLGKGVILNNQRVCSKHFLKQDIDKSIPSRIRIKKNAIPFLSSFVSMFLIIISQLKIIAHEKLYVKVVITIIMQ